MKRTKAEGSPGAVNAIHARRTTAVVAAMEVRAGKPAPPEPIAAAFARVIDGSPTHVFVYGTTASPFAST